MKFILILIFLVLANTQVFANDNASNILNYDGQNQVQQTLNFITQESRTKIETYMGTCYNYSVPYQYYDCNYQTRGYDRVCRKIPYRGVVCENVPIRRRICGYITRYRTETYSCTKTRKVYYTVDVQVTAFVKLEVVDSRDYVNNLSLSLNVSQSNIASLALHGNNSSNIMAVTNLTSKLKEQTQFSKVILVKGKLSLIDANKFQTPLLLGIKNINLNRSTLSFQTGNFSNIFPVNIYVKVTRRGSVFRKRETVLNQNFKAANLSSIINAGYKTFNLNLSSLGVKIKSKKKYDVEIVIKAEVSGTILGQTGGKLTLSASRDKIKI